MRGRDFYSQQFLTFGIPPKETMIDQIIEYYKNIVAQKCYETHPLVPKDIVVPAAMVARS